MTKTLVKSTRETDPIPFLRGILTHSLQTTTGLSFADAYQLASKVRQELNDRTEVTTTELRDRVGRHLEKTYGTGFMSRYLRARESGHTIMVRGADGQSTPFSRGQYRRLLECTGMTVEQSLDVADRLYKHLLKQNVREIESSSLGYLTYRLLRRQLGLEVARRYLVWVDFLRSGRPLLLLIGGTSGCGKSTIANELANRLDIVRTQSTDMLREVMRMMIPERLLPGLYASSFNAWQTLPSRVRSDTDHNVLLADGYRAQAWLLSVPCEAVIQRALRERVSLILEGVHISPELLDKIPKDTDALVVAVMMAVLDRDRLKRQIKGRGQQVTTRRSERYLEYFSDIWRLQSYLLSEADRAHLPIIANDDKETAVKRILEVITETLSEGFSAKPRQIFSKTLETKRSW